MADASSHQPNFQAGEWSPSRTGRVDDARYKAALATCLNYIPTKEGSLKPRSGFWNLGQTLRGKEADLLPFRFSAHNAYVLEYSSDALEIPSGSLRIWSNGSLVIRDTLKFTSVSTGGTPTFTMTHNFPTNWNYSAVPQTCLIHFDDVYGMEKAPHLVGREFLLQLTGPNTCTLADIGSGSTITTPVSATFTGTIYLVFQMVYKPVTLPFLPVVGGHRIVEYSSQQLFNNGLSASVPDQRAVLMSAFTPPIVFSSARGITNPEYAEFIDGPYFDSNGPNTPVSVSGTTGDITVQLYPYVATHVYPLYSIAADSSGNGYASIVANQVGHALPGGVADAHWARLPIAWNSGTTYALGAAALGDPTNGGVSTVYYSTQASNTNHPLTDPAYWDIVPPAYAGGTTYALGVVVIAAGIEYVSIQTANVGNTPASSPTFWLPIDFTIATTNRQNVFSSTDASDTLAASDSGYPGTLLNYAHTGRVIRLKVGPAPWSNLVTYAKNDLVNFGDVIYKSNTNSNLNNEPDIDAVNWTIQTTTIQWTWGSIKTWINTYKATVTVKGDDLLNSNTLYEYRLGLYSSSTGWPTSGTYHEGRLILTSAASGPLVIMGVPNRIDMGQPNLGFSFAPTAPDGTVADSNGVAMTFNSSKSEVISGLASTVDGILVTTDCGEHIVTASNLNDPITPTSAQAKKATTFGAAPAELVPLTSSHAFIQQGFRRLIEYKSFVDVTAYQVRPNGSDLTRDCQHLTTTGIAAAAYNSIPQPVIWCLKGRMNEIACNEQMDFFPHSLFGIGYARNPDETYVAPFSVELGYDYINNTLPGNISSFAVQFTASATRENLHIAGEAPAGFGNGYYIQMLEPVLDTSGPPPPDWNFFNNVPHNLGTLTDTQKMMASGCFLDDAVAPVGVKIAADSTSVTYYGLWKHARETVSFVIMGKYIGDFLIGNDGSVTIPFTNGASVDASENGNFSIWDVGSAMVSLPTEHSYGYQEFVYDPNGTDWAVYDYDIVADQTHVVDKYCGYFGYRYRRRGQTLRPLLGSQNGPTPFAKTKRQFKMALDVEQAHEVTVGSTFGNVQSLPLTVDGTADVTPLAIDGLTSGTFRENIIADYDFNGQLCWEQTFPYPGAILGVGGFYSVADL